MGADAITSPPTRAKALFNHWAGPPVLIILIGLVCLSPLWTSRGVVYSKHSDIIAEHLGVKALGQRSVDLHGRLPLWNPHMNCGAPAFAAPESMYVFPFDLLYLFLPLDRATNGVILLNVVLAGLTMYLFCRGFLNHRASALFCGVAYMVSYRYLSMIHAGWLPKMSMYALTPLLFWSCDRVLRLPGVRRSAVWAGIVGLCFMQSDMQGLYYSGLGCLLFAGVRLIRQERALRLRGLGCLAAGGILGVMFSAPVLFPRIEFAALSSRAEPTYEFFVMQPPVLKDTKTFLDPLDEGGARDEFWEKNFYFGRWLYPLCIVGVVGRRRSSGFLLAAMLGVLLLCFNTPALKLLYTCLPGFGLFRQSSKLLLLGQFILLLLGGLGADVLLADRERHRIVSRLFPVLMICAAGIALYPTSSLGTYARCAMVLTIGLAGASVLLPRLGAGVLSVLLLALPGVDAGVRFGRRIETRPLQEAIPRHAFLEALRRDVVRGRTAAIGRTTIPYGMAGCYDVELANGFTALNLKHYLEYFAVLQYGDPNRGPKGPWIWTDLNAMTKPQMLQAMDVEYLVANQPYDFDPIGYEKTAAFENVPVFSLYRGIVHVPVHVYRRRDRLGAAFFATSVRAVSDEAASLHAVASAESPRDAYVLGLDVDPNGIGGTGGAARMVRQGIDEYEYQVDSRGRNLLILSQVWYPGWRAVLEGRPVRLYRTNHAWMACIVPPGSHRLRLEMTCPRFWQGLAATGAAGVAMAAWFMVERRRWTPRAKPT